MEEYAEAVIFKEFLQHGRLVTAAEVRPPHYAALSSFFQAAFVIILLLYAERCCFGRIIRMMQVPAWQWQRPAHTPR